MNQKRAKRIRQKIYGKFSSRTREYRTTKEGTIINIGLRALYLSKKKRTV